MDQINRRQALQHLGWQAGALTLGSCAFLPGCVRPGEGGAAVDPEVELAFTAAPSEVAILPGAPTRVWRYTASVVRGPAGTVVPVADSYLGPTLRLRTGQRVRVRFRNHLPEPSIIHWHGLDVPERADGHPRLAVESGGEYVYDFQVTNRAGTYWYHPHPHMRTGAQVYQGMAGLLLVTDSEEEALGLPSAEAELLWVLQDRRVDGANQFVYAGAPDAEQPGPGMGRRRGMGGMGMGMGDGRHAAMMETMSGWLGDRVLVSGRPQPALTLDRRAYRIRLLNGSNARIYRLAWDDGTPLTVIGTDGGLLERPHQHARLTLAPGQRADVLLDLSQRAVGSRLTFRSEAYPAAAIGRVGMMAETSPLPQGAAIDLVRVTVGRGTGPVVRIPERLSTPPASWARVADAPVRPVGLVFIGMEWLINGRAFELEGTAADEVVTAGSTHVWEVTNAPNPMGMAMAHPLHVHGTQFRVLARTGAEGHPLAEGLQDEGARDTVLVLPGETVRVQLTFSQHPGLYLYHCHILEHEDMGMMRNFRITSRT